MRTNRRAFLGMAATAGLVGLRPSLLAAQTAGVKFPPPKTSGPTSLPPPISSAERMQRIAKAQQLMRAAGLKALLVEAGSSLVYFTGVQWWRSERLTAGLIPAEGEPVLITPAFEEPSLRLLAGQGERLLIGAAGIGSSPQTSAQIGPRGMR